MPTVQDRASEALRLLTDAQAQTDDITQVRNETLGRLDAMTRALRSRPDPVQVGRGRGITAAQQKLQLQAQEAEQQRRQRYELTTARIKDRLDKLGLSPDQQFLSREQGQLGAVLDSQLAQEMAELSQRIGTSGDNPLENPEFLQLQADREVLRNNEAKFHERYGRPVQYKPNGDPILPHDSGFQGENPISAELLGELQQNDNFFADTAGKIGGGAYGLAGIAASAAGFEDTGASLAQRGADFQADVGVNNLADRAVGLEFNDIQERARLPEDDPRHLSIADASLRSVQLALTDIDAFQNVSSSVIAAGATAGPLGTGLKAAGAVAKAAPIIGGLARGTSRVANTRVGQAITGGPAVGQATRASLAGQGQGVDGTLTQEEAIIRAGGGVASGRVGQFFTPAESVVNNAARSIGNRITSRVGARTSPNRGVGALRGGVQGAGSTAIAETGQGAIDIAAETIGAGATERELGVFEALNDPKLREEALFQVQLNAPLEGAVGGAFGGPTGVIDGLSHTKRQKAIAKKAAADKLREEGKEEAARVAEEELAAEVERDLLFVAQVDATKQALNRERNLKARDPANLNVSEDAAGVTNLDNYFFQDLDAEANFEGFNAQPVEIQEIALRAMYQQNEGLDAVGEDAFIDSVLGPERNKKFSKKEGLEGFQRALEKGVRDSNSTDRLTELRREVENTRAEEARVSAENDAIQTEADLLNDRETELRGDPIADDTTDTSVSIDDIGTRSRREASLASEFFSRDTANSNLRDFHNLPDDAARERRLRVLYRQTPGLQQSSTAENTFISETMQRYRRLVDDPDLTLNGDSFIGAVSASSEIAGNNPALLEATFVDPATLPGTPPVTPETETTPGDRFPGIRDPALGPQRRLTDVLTDLNNGNDPSPGQIRANIASIESLRELEDTAGADGTISDGIISDVQKDLAAQDEIPVNLTEVFFGDDSQTLVNEIGTLTPIEQQGMIRALLRNDENIGNAAEQEFVNTLGFIEPNTPIAEVQARITQAFNDSATAQQLPATGTGGTANLTTGGQAARDAGQFFAGQQERVNAENSARTEAVRPIDEVREGIVEQVINENLIPRGEVDPATGQVSDGTLPGNIDPVAVEELATRPASVTNTLLNDNAVTETDTTGGFVRRVRDSSLIALRGMRPSQRRRALAELARRDGLDSTQANEFADIVERDLGRTSNEFATNISSAFAAAGGTVPTGPPTTGPGGTTTTPTTPTTVEPRLTPEQTYGVVNTGARNSETTDSNSQAEGVFDITPDPAGEPRLTLSDEIRNYLNQITGDPVPGQEGLLRDIGVARENGDVFTPQGAVSLLNRIHQLERLRSNSGK